MLLAIGTHCQWVRNLIVKRLNLGFANKKLKPVFKGGQHDKNFAMVSTFVISCCCSPTFFEHPDKPFNRIAQLVASSVKSGPHLLAVTGWHGRLYRQLGETIVQSHTVVPFILHDDRHFMPCRFECLARRVSRGARLAWEHQ